MPASPEAARRLRRFARAVARRWRLADHFDEALSIIVTELVTNVVMHSGSPWVSTVISVRGDALTVEVMDGGCWKHRRDRRQEPLDADVPCGRGLRLVDAYAHRTVASRSETGSVVLAEMALEGDRAAHAAVGDVWAGASPCAGTEPEAGTRPEPRGPSTAGAPVRPRTDPPGTRAASGGGPERGPGRDADPDLELEVETEFADVLDDRHPAERDRELAEELDDMEIEEMERDLDLDLDLDARS
ncbi:ATP-binding protein [Streptomyces sp. t39]|uniref:ATP-binding protein n=1 Tax=Streptomyces sp. t39 TaxID=1828156 RepID=UPI0021C82953|nr:ATP-binding protein [Streptomyces sp. t39]